MKPTLRILAVIGLFGAGLGSGWLLWGVRPSPINSTQPAVVSATVEQVADARDIVRTCSRYWLPDITSRRNEAELKARAKKNIDGVVWVMDRAMDGEHRRMAWVILSEVSGDRLGPIALRAMENTAAEVRYEALRTLHRVLKEDQLVGMYIRLIQKDDSALVRSEAARIMESHPTPEAVPALERLLWDEYGETRFAAARTLLSWDIPEARDAIERVIASRDPVAAGTLIATRAYPDGRLTDDEVPIIEQYLAHEVGLLESRIRPNLGGYFPLLVNLLGDAGQESSLPVLRRMLDTGGHTEQVTEAIAKIEGKP